MELDTHQFFHMQMQEEDEHLEELIEGPQTQMHQGLKHCGNEHEVVAYFAIHS